MPVQWRKATSANCPEFFADNERDDYAGFLDAEHAGYEVGEVDGDVVAAFGLLTDDANERRLCWIMLDPAAKGSGLGALIMNRVIDAGQESQAPSISIAASHRSAPFFLCWWNYSVHYPFQAPKDLIQKYEKRRGPGIPALSSLSVR